MGASRIQGITVEIGGDTTKLTAALKGVNGEIRTTQSQLRDVNNLLKLDPGNTELLAQKHRLLADAVRETKEKLETLKAAAEQANEALAKGEITQEQYDGLQREIIETEERLKSLEEQANQSAVAVQKIAAVGEDLKNLGDKISGVGTTLTKTVTTPIVGLGTVAVKTAADFDTAMSQVGAVSGATGKDLDALRDKAREMGSKTKFSASEAAEAMNYMAMAGWKTSDMLSGIEGIMNLAAASGEGPLSNFHTFMPDMIDLLGKGIRGNLGKLTGPMKELAGMLIPTTGAMESISSAGNGGNGNDSLAARLDAMYEVVTKYLPRLANSQVVLDSGVLVGELSDGLNRELGKAYS